MDIAQKKAERQMCFEETELRLGLPGNGGGSCIEGEVGRKRGLSETETAPSETTSADWMLKLSSEEKGEGKYPVSDRKAKNMTEEKMLLPADPAKPPAKAQVVGWPPVRSFRKNILATQKNSTDQENEKGSTGNANFVKVSIDGAPYLRKVDLQIYQSYQQLSDALGKMFSSFTAGMKDFMNESKMMDLLNNSDYVPTYQDKDGDWMLVGDVPWEMFVQSCKRLRIVKGNGGHRTCSKSHGEVPEQKLDSCFSAVDLHS